MMTPGFTAEVALPAAEAIYRTVPGRPGGVPTVAALPSAGSSTDVNGGCIEGCVCVTAEGCPCCDVVASQQPITLQESTVAKRPAGNRFTGTYAAKHG